MLLRKEKIKQLIPSKMKEWLTKSSSAKIILVPSFLIMLDIILLLIWKTAQLVFGRENSLWIDGFMLEINRFVWGDVYSWGIMNIFFFIWAVWASITLPSDTERNFSWFIYSVLGMCLFYTVGRLVSGIGHISEKTEALCAMYDIAALVALTTLVVLVFFLKIRYGWKDIFENLAVRFCTTYLLINLSSFVSNVQNFSNDVSFTFVKENISKIQLVLK